MTPDDLRALAVQLEANYYGEPARNAADYLRAQADAQPVAIVVEQRSGAWAGADTPAGYVWSPPSDSGTKMIFPLADLPLGTKLYAHPAQTAPAGWKLVPVEPTPEMLDEGCDVDARAEVIKKYAAMPVIRNPENCCSCGEMLAVQYRAMLAAAPAVPAIEERGPWSAGQDKQQPWEQRVWIESDDFTHDVRLYVNGDFESGDQRFAYAQEIARRLNAAPAVPQAEQPIDLDAVAMQQMRQAAAESTWMPAEYSGSDWISDVCRWLRDGPPQAEPKREPLTDERITKGEYVFATKWDDGDPGDHWGVGFYDRFANGRHYVVDSAGKQIRGNGFRRVGRITVEVGRWLLSAGKSLEASPPGTVNLWTMLTERAYRIGGSDAE